MDDNSASLSASLSASDLMALYSEQFLTLARDIPHGALFSPADRVANKRAPLCGSTITVCFNLKDGRIINFGQEVKACALGRASASLFGRGVIGSSYGDIEKGLKILKDILSDQKISSSSRFLDLEIFESAQSYQNRHASILLAWEVTLDAWKNK